MCSLSCSFFLWGGGVGLTKKMHIVVCSFDLSAPVTPLRDASGLLCSLLWSGVCGQMNSPAPKQKNWSEVHGCPSGVTPVWVVLTGPWDLGIVGTHGMGKPLSYAQWTHAHYFCLAWSPGCNMQIPDWWLMVPPQVGLI